MSLANVDAYIAKMRQGLADFEKECIEVTKNAARVVTREMMDRTPVWSGRTVRNFQWGVGSAPGGEIEPSGSTSRQQPTNSLGLGSEPNRGANEAAALAEMESVLSGVTKLSNLVCSNNSKAWDLVDNGSAPTPDRSRNPGGVSDAAVQATKEALGDAFK